jgi:D-lactate dehydrogenase
VPSKPLKIAFFEVTEQERAFLRAQKEFAGAKLFAEEMHRAPAAAYRDADVASVFIYSKVDASVLKNAPRLRLVATRSTGYDHVDLAGCRKKGVTVCNVPHYGENTVAEHTFALILALSRKVHQAYIRTVRGDFSFTGLQGFDLKGKTLGVVGTGRIGLHVVRIASGFGMRVLAYDIRKDSLLAEALGFTYAPLDDLLAQSDIVTLHTPYLPSTHHLMDARRIARMKKGALLINTARGGLVDTEALAKALDSGHLAGAGLDVVEGEDLVKEENQILSKQFSVEKMRTLLQTHILLHRENVVITPHIGFNSIEAFLRILQTTLSNVRAFRDDAPENVVAAR